MMPTERRDFVEGGCPLCLAYDFSINKTNNPLFNGSASGSRSVGCMFDSRRVQNPGYELDRLLPSLWEYAVGEPGWFVTEAPSLSDATGCIAAMTCRRLLFAPFKTDLSLKF
ncbi:hypothetical protein FXO38_33295 [Capsicum annuum]|nr:hypothetical protein FXO38_33295 [Capsicum annuum]